MKIITLLLSLFLTACSFSGESGNLNVPNPAKSLDLERYLGKWYEIARYENRFEKGCEGVTATYTKKQDGTIEVKNECREGSPTGAYKASIGSAKVVDGAKLKVSFFLNIYLGNYWVLDRADDYSWSIVGEPSGKYLWLLARSPNIDKQILINRAAKLGYEVKMLKIVQH